MSQETLEPTTEQPGQAVNESQQQINSTEPQTEKRFSLSRENFAQERIDAVKNAVDKIKQERPEVLSLTLYGSMVRDTPKQESDIDGWLFVDADQVAALHPGEAVVEKMPKTETIVFPLEIASSYAQELRDKIGSVVDLSEEQLKHLRVTPIDKSIIDIEVERIIEGQRQVDEYKEQAKQRSQLMETDFNTYLNLPRVDYPNYYGPNANLYEMFHLAVGKGIEKYRTYLIEELSQKGEAGEVAWQSIISSTESFENQGETNTGKKYPRTLEEAKRVYGSRSEIHEQIAAAKQNQEDEQKIAEIREHLASLPNSEDSTGGS